MTANYQQSGVRFMYPENWELDNREDSGLPWTVSVHSPTGAFWSITVHDATTDPKTLGDKALKTVEQECQEIYFESEVVTDQVGGDDSPGYDIYFYCLDFLVAARVRSFWLDQHSCVVLYQAEDQDFEQLEQVFRAITESLFRSGIELDPA